MNGAMANGRAAVILCRPLKARMATEHTSFEQQSMRIVILHPAIPPNATLEDQDSMVQVQTVSAALERLGHKPVAMPCTLDFAAMQQGLAEQRPELVFNLVESVDGADSLQYLPPAVLDSLGLPYTGAPTEAIFQTTHKLLAKQILHLAGLPTPTWLSSNAGATGDAEFSWEGPAMPPSTPCIIKAVWEHASRGLDETSVVTADDLDSLRDRLRRQGVESGRPCFAEQFVEGREFNVALLGDGDHAQVLPLAEIDFSAFPPDKHRIVGHKAKWQEDSFEYHNTPRRFDFPPEDRKLLDQLHDLAAACWKLFGLRGYARVDFRVDRHGWPWILEINTNPCLSPDAGFAAALEQAGIGFDQAIQRILDQAIAPAK
jgi:D-alanine-D-alanine ligase